MTPYLLLDIDNTLNPDLTGVWDGPQGYIVRGAGWKRTPDSIQFNGRPIFYNPWVGEMLLGIASRTGAQLAWATRWMQLANQWFSPAIGLPNDLPTAPTNPLQPKADTVLPWAAGRPLVWLDDEQDVADNCTLPWQRCVQVSPLTGVHYAALRLAEEALREVTAAAIYNLAKLDEPPCG